MILRELSIPLRFYFLFTACYIIWLSDIKAREILSSEWVTSYTHYITTGVTIGSVLPDNCLSRNDVIHMLHFLCASRLNKDREG